MITSDDIKMNRKKQTGRSQKTGKFKVAATESQVKTAGEKVMKKYDKAIKGLAFR